MKYFQAICQYIGIIHRQSKLTVKLEYTSSRRDVNHDVLRPSNALNQGVSAVPKLACKAHETCVVPNKHQ